MRNGLSFGQESLMDSLLFTKNCVRKITMYSIHEMLYPYVK